MRNANSMFFQGVLISATPNTFEMNWNTRFSYHVRNISWMTNLTQIQTLQNLLKRLPRRVELISTAKGDYIWSTYDDRLSTYIWLYTVQIWMSAPRFTSLIHTPSFSCNRPLESDQDKAVKQDEWMMDVNSFMMHSLICLHQNVHVSVIIIINFFLQEPVAPFWPENWKRSWKSCCTLMTHSALRLWPLFTSKR